MRETELLRQHLKCEEDLRMLHQEHEAVLKRQLKEAQYQMTECNGLLQKSLNA
jgi:hypothetical protein